MKLKKFNQYIKENYENLLPSDNEVEHTAKGEDLTPHGEEGHPEHTSEIEAEDDFEDEDGNEEVEIDVKGELSKLDKEILRKIATGEIDACDIAKEILECGDEDECEDSCDEDDLEDDEDFDDFDEEDFDEDDFGDDEGLEIHKFQLENLSFKNFKRRK